MTQKPHRVSPVSCGSSFPASVVVWYDRTALSMLHLLPSATRAGCLALGARSLTAPEARCARAGSARATTILVCICDTHSKRPPSDCMLALLPVASSSCGLKQRPAGGPVSTTVVATTAARPSGLRLPVPSRPQEAALGLVAGAVCLPPPCLLHGSSPHSPGRYLLRPQNHNRQRCRTESSPQPTSVGSPMPREPCVR